MSCCGSSWDDFLINLGLKNDSTPTPDVDGKKGKDISTACAESSATIGTGAKNEKKRLSVHSTSTSSSDSRTDAKPKISHNKSRRLFRHSSENSDKTVTSQSSDEETVHENEQILAQKFPGSTPMERKRFLAGRSVDRAADKIERFVKWREQYNLDGAFSSQQNETESDADAWELAVAHTAKHSQCSGSLPLTLPRIIKCGETEELRALDGKRITLVLPGLIDKQLAPLDFYARCVGIYLDAKLDRDSDESMYVLVDVRSGLNWPNSSPTTLLPFVKSLNQQLSDTMPERMCHMYIYPIPLLAKPIWRIFKGFLDRKVVAKISILWGSAATSSSIPKGMLNDLVDEEIINSIEDMRSLEFIYQI